ncbi:hypothetical protein E1301_Tti023792 [Triplophysa tibetana]|uniref:Uncharacterized protein n=1 Tax=Triplophysa tibetana TaxID=1572043 RepID=A0A5A9PCV8_9TELE|nr:hypothetical protein E1301_Tti023792 [Triplophysa tibetana]
MTRNSKRRALGYLAMRRTAARAYRLEYGQSAPIQSGSRRPDMRTPLLKFFKASGGVRAFFTGSPGGVGTPRHCGSRSGNFPSVSGPLQDLGKIWGRWRAASIRDSLEDDITLEEN